MTDTLEVLYFYEEIALSEIMKNLLKNKNVETFFLTPYGYTLTSRDLPSSRIIGIVNPSKEDMVYLQLIGVDLIKIHVSDSEIRKIILCLHNGIEIPLLSPSKIFIDLFALPELSALNLLNKQ